MPCLLLLATACSFWCSLSFQGTKISCLSLWQLATFLLLVVQLVIFFPFEEVFVLSRTVSKTNVHENMFTENLHEHSIFENH